MEIFLTYLKVFLTGGVICMIAQFLMDKTNITPARILVLFVTLGVFLTGIGLYEPLVEFGKSGATVPISGFGYSLAKGVISAVDKEGLLGVLTGGITKTAAGIASAIFFGYFFALISKPDIKNTK